MNRIEKLVKSERGLTLVEIIVVLIILSIVIAFVGGRVFGAGDKAKADLTRIQLQQARSYLEQFQLRYNALPSSLESLTTCTEETGQGCVPVTNADSLKDAWNRPLVYQRDGDRAYRLKSLGADGREGGEGVNYDVAITGP